MASLSKTHKLIIIGAVALLSFFVFMFFLLMTVHGSSSPLKVLFPFPKMFTTKEDSIGIPLLALGVLQYPFYLGLYWWAKIFKEDRYNTFSLVLIYIISIFLAFIFGGK